MNGSRSPVDISAIIPAYNAAALIDDCVRCSAGACRSCYSMETIVVDDGLIDGTADRVQALAETFPCPFER